MAECSDCFYHKNCQFLLKHKTADVNGCTSFEDKSEWVHLPRKPLPLLKDDNPYNTDVYCPSCGENVSGYGIEIPMDIVACFNCGEILNITKAVAREEAEDAIKGKGEQQNERM